MESMIPRSLRSYSTTSGSKESWCFCRYFSREHLDQLCCIQTMVSIRLDCMFVVTYGLEQ